MKLYPLVFSFRDPIIGNGFVAAVAMDGYALLSEEADGFWIDGVQPGAMAAGAEQRDKALQEFKKTYMGVLFEYAADSTSFTEFKGKVESFFSAVCEPSLAEWKKAVEIVKMGNVTLPGIVTVKAETRMPLLSVVEVGKSNANSGVNEFDNIAQAA